MYEVKSVLNAEEEAIKWNCHMHLLDWSFAKYLMRMNVLYSHSIYEHTDQILNH